MPDNKQIKGWESLDRKLAELSNPREQRKVIRSALNFATTPVVQTARADAPRGSDGHRTYKGRMVAPGFASRSVRRKVRIIGKSIVASIGVAKEAFYAVQFFERGTKHIDADPWLEPALEKNRDKAIERFGRKMRERIEKIKRKR